MRNLLQCSNSCYVYQLPIQVDASRRDLQCHHCPFAYAKLFYLSGSHLTPINPPSGNLRYLILVLLSVQPTTLCTLFFFSRQLPVCFTFNGPITLFHSIIQSPSIMLRTPICFRTTKSHDHRFGLINHHFDT